jgi:hypothetical protein
MRQPMEGPIVLARRLRKVYHGADEVEACAASTSRSSAAR